MKNEVKLRLRADTPGSTNTIYFDNAGASLLSRGVTDTLKAAIDAEMLEGGYRFAERQQAALHAVKVKIATLIHAKAKDIALVDSASRAFLLALQSFHFKAGDEIITSQIEYGANLAAFSWLERYQGVRIKVLPFDSDSGVDLSAIPRLCTPQTRVLALTYCPANNGYCLDARLAGVYAKECGLYYLLDACQAVGQLDVDVAELNCDFLSATGRKYLRAPRGTGFLYSSDRAREQLPPVLSDHTSGHWTSFANPELARFEYDNRAEQFECWEKSTVNILGLGQALDELLQLGIETVTTEIQALAQDLRQGLASNRQIQVLDLGEQLSGIVAFSLKGACVNAFHQALSKKQLQIGVSQSAAAPWFKHTANAPVIARVSPHCFNTREEIARFLEGAFDLLATKSKSKQWH